MCLASRHVFFDLPLSLLRSPESSLLPGCDLIVWRRSTCPVNLLHLTDHTLNRIFLFHLVQCNMQLTKCAAWLIKHSKNWLSKRVWQYQYMPQSLAVLGRGQRGCPQFSPSPLPFNDPIPNQLSLATNSRINRQFNP